MEPFFFSENENFPGNVILNTRFQFDQNYLLLIILKQNVLTLFK